jgi:hypothetical protein
MYICPGHTVTQKKMGQFTQENEYDSPQESISVRQYDTINADDVQRNSRRTDENTDCHAISEILLKVSLNTIISTLTLYYNQTVIIKT